MNPKIRKISLILCTAVLSACSTINLATYNVCTFHHSGTNSTRTVASMMKEWNLDALGVNELDSCTARRGEDVYQLQDLAGELGDWEYNFAGAIDFKGGKYGIGVTTPHRILNRWSLRLPRSDDREYRALDVVETEKFVFCCTHLGLRLKSQLDQIEVINDFIDGHFAGYGKPVFLCGDLNAYPGSETLKALEKDWTVLSVTDDTTFSTDNPSSCIDYILLYRNAAQCKAVRSFVGKSFKTGNIQTASDHFPVFLKVRL